MPLRNQQCEAFHFVAFLAIAALIAGVASWMVLDVGPMTSDVVRGRADMQGYRERQTYPKKPTGVAHGEIQRKAPPRTDHPENFDQAAVDERWLYRIRAFPHRHVPHGARVRAFEQARRMRPVPQMLANMSVASIPDSAQHWTLIGPRPTLDGYAGRVTAIAIHPHDNNTVYIGGAEGGVWKTTDGGLNWKPLSDFEPALAIGSLVIDPADPNTIYAGTGEQNFNFDAYGGIGILKSVDAGSTWTVVAGDVFDQQSIGRLAIAPGNSQLILAAADGGVYRSADAGSTWQNVQFGPATDVLFDPSDSNIAYAAIGAPFAIDSAGVYKSTDTGQTWKISNGTAPKALPSSDKIGRIGLAISRSSPKTLYAGIESLAVESSSGVLYKSSDGGSTWTATAGSAYCTKQCWYNNVLAVNPVNPKILLGGGVDLRSSADGGVTWYLAALGQDVHVDQHAIAFTADGARVFVGNDGGVWASPATKAGFSWNSLNATLAITQFYPGLSIHPSDPKVSFGGTQDNSSLAYSGLMQWERVSCGDGAATAIDPLNPTNVYVTCAGARPGPVLGVVQKSLYGGARGTFRPSDNGLSRTEGVPFLPYITIDPTHPQNLYITGNQHIYQSTNGGSLWSRVSPDVTAGYLPPCAIAVAPTDSNTVYSGSCDGMVWVTHNALSGTGSTWQDVSSGLPGNAVTHITIDPSSRRKAYVTISGFQAGHVFLTEDGGGVWTDISGNLPDISANDLIADPDLPGTLYVATDLGVFWTNTTGRVWSPLGDGLPNAAALSLAFERTSRTLRAATHGRSVWDLLVLVHGLNLIPLVSSVSPVHLPLNTADLKVTVNGKHFTSASLALWDGHERPTTFISGEEIMADLEAADVTADTLIPLTVFTPGPGGGTSLPTYLKVGPNPAIYPGAFLNAASFLAGGGVAPGSIVSVFGVNLAPKIATFSGVPLPDSLGDVSLTVADDTGFLAAAPLFFVSTGQINFQVPWEVQPFGTATFTPVVSGAKGEPVSVNMRLFAPGLFTIDQTGHGQGSVNNALTGQLAAPIGKYPNAQPVKRGGYISIYCTGLGPIDNPPPDGAPAPLKPLAKTLIQPVVLIGGVQATVSFSGLAPGFIGLNQINAQVPHNAPTGDAVPLSVSDGFGGNSNTVTVAIQ